MTKSARCTFSSVGQLRVDPGLGLGRGEAVALDDACHLLAARAAGHDHPIEVAIAARLVEQRDVDDGQALAGGGETIEPRAGRLADARMDDGFEIGAGLRVAEHHDAEGAAIEAAVGQEDVGPEALGHGRQARRAGRDGVARQHVRVEGRDAVRRQPRADIALAGCDAAGERRAQQGHGPAQPSARSPSWAAASRSSTKVFHSWQCGHCQSSSLLR